MSFWLLKNLCFKDGTSLLPKDFSLPESSFLHVKILIWRHLNWNVRREYGRVAFSSAAWWRSVFSIFSRIPLSNHRKFDLIKVYCSVFIIWTRNFEQPKTYLCGGLRQNSDQLSIGQYGRRASNGISLSNDLRIKRIYLSKSPQLLKYSCLEWKMEQDFYRKTFRSPNRTFFIKTIF